MKIFAIRDDETVNKDLAYLIYYEKDKKFYIELPDNADLWETPLILSSFLKKGIKTINSYWSKLWVQQRIVPTDRQNLGSILKENDLSEYDEYELLVKSKGRCAQDNYYIIPVDVNIIQSEFADRYEKKVDNVVPLKNNRVLVFFRNGEIKICNISKICNDNRYFGPVLSSSSVFEKVSVEAGGYGIKWGENAMISDHELYECGEIVPLELDDFVSFITNTVVSSAEAAELMNCSRQNVNDLVTRGKLHPVKAEQKNTLFLKSEIMQRLWK